MSQPQEIVTLPFVSPVLQDKETLESFVLAFLEDDEQIEVIKASCCIYTENESLSVPEWYTECNGKLWFNQHLLN